MGGFSFYNDLMLCTCAHCEAESIWYMEKPIYPKGSSAPLHHEEMTSKIAEDYDEARSVVDDSPRAAAALLRLAIEKLTIELGAVGDDLNTRIGDLVRKGLAPAAQQALDSLRVIGNEAVHPGQLDLKDNQETAIKLFDVMNFIIEEMITRPKKIEDIYSIIPESKKEQIERRDRG